MVVGYSPRRFARTSIAIPRMSALAVDFGSLFFDLVLCQSSSDSNNSHARDKSSRGKLQSVRMTKVLSK